MSCMRPRLSRSRADEPTEWPTSTGQCRIAIAAFRAATSFDIDQRRPTLSAHQLAIFRPSLDIRLDHRPAFLPRREAPTAFFGSIAGAICTQ